MCHGGAPDIEGPRSRHRTVELQQEPFGPEDDLDVLVGEGVFEHGDGDGPHFKQSGLGRFTRFGRLVAQLLDESSGAVLEARVDAVDDQECSANKLLGRRKDVEKDRLINRLTREVGQDDELARLEQRLGRTGPGVSAPRLRASLDRPAAGPGQDE